MPDCAVLRFKLWISTPRRGAEDCRTRETKARPIASTHQQRGRARSSPGPIVLRVVVAGGSLRLRGSRPHGALVSVSAPDPSGGVGARLLGGRAPGCAHPSHRALRTYLSPRACLRRPSNQPRSRQDRWTAPGCRIRPNPVSRPSLSALAVPHIGRARLFLAAAAALCRELHT